MRSNMQISQTGINLIKKFEGCKLTAYYCPAGVPTIGYGHTKTVSHDDVRRKKTINQSQAHGLLKEDLTHFEKAVSGLVKVELDQNHFDVLVSFTFNCGAGALKKSTLLKKLNQGKHDEVPEQLMRWVHAGGKKLRGLERRRRAEADLWLKNDASDHFEQMPQMVDSPEKTLAQSKTIKGLALAGSGETIRLMGEEVQSLSNNFLFSSELAILASALTISGLALILYSKLQSHFKD